MSQSQSPSPMFARSVDPSASRTAPKSPKLSRPEKELLPPEARPEDIFEFLREFIEAGQIGQARRLIREGLRRFPGHQKIRLAKHILSDGKATPNPYVQPTATEEIEWLKSPPEEARGRWVALIGSEVVGMADSAEDLMQSLKTRNFEYYPLVQYLAR